MATSMHRLQVCLPESQVQYLTHRARAEGVSIAELIRRLVETASKTTSGSSINSLWEIAGIGEDRDPLIDEIPVSEKPEMYLAVALQRGASRQKKAPRRKRTR